VGAQSPLPVAAMGMQRTEIPQNRLPVEVAEVVEQKPVPGAPIHPKSSNTVSLEK
jgi:hypothetical protein